MKKNSDKSTQRPHLDNHEGLHWGSMAACASANGIPLHWVQKAKKEGCKAFRNARVDKEAFLDWLERNPCVGNSNAPTELEAQELRKIKAEADRVELRNKIMAGDYISVKEVMETVHAVAAELFSYWRQMEETLPIKLQGLSIPEMRSLLQREFDEIRKKVSEGKLDDLQNNPKKIVSGKIAIDDEV